MARALPLLEGMSKADDLQNRTRLFAINAIEFCRSISRSIDTDRITSQLIGTLSLGDPEKAATLHQESMELMRIFGKSAGTARRRRQ